MKKRMFISIAAVALLGGALAVFRTPLQNMALDQVIHSLEDQYQAEIEMEGRTWDGLEGLSLEQLSFVKKNEEVKLYLTGPEMQVPVWGLLSGHPRLESLSWESAELEIYRPQAKAAEGPRVPNLSLANQVYPLLTKVSGAFPAQLDLNENWVRIFDGGDWSEWFAWSLKLEDGYLETVVSTFGAEYPEQMFMVSGDLHPRDMAADLLVESAAGDPGLPLAGGRVSFGQLRLTASSTRVENEEIGLNIRLRMDELAVAHPLLSEDTLRIPKVDGEFLAEIAPRRVSLAKGSSVTLGPLYMEPTLRVDAAQGTLAMGLDFPEQPTWAYLNALPEQGFDHLRGLDIEGVVSAEFGMDYDPKRPELLAVKADVKEDGLEVVSWGKTDPTLLNRDFLYLPEFSTRMIRMGAKNPNYLALEKVSAQMQACVRLAEDANFYHHRGFDAGVLRRALIDNYTQGEVVRGGSTIPMQLMKNVFLGREQTLERKLEEAVLVGLVERSEAITKDRMLEVYLNVVEFGDEIYGLQEAAQYYFGKSAAALTANECIFLSGIIPNPEFYDDFFEWDGSLSQFGESYFEGMAWMLSAEGLITEAEFDGLAAPKLIGEAGALFFDGPAEGMSATN